MGGGVGFYIRKGISARICPHPQPTPAEQMWLSMSINGTALIVGTAYRPPWQDISTFLDALTESVASFVRCDKIILLGDFNIDLLNLNSNKTKLLNQFIQSLNLKQIIGEPTHFTEVSQSLIDIICTDTKVRRVVVKHTPDLGGHAMLLAEINLKKEKTFPHLITYRPFKNILIDLFNNDLNKIYWDYFRADMGINDMVKTFTLYIVTLFDLHAPLKTTKFKVLPHPWITDTIKKMISIRDGYQSRYKLHNLESYSICYKNMKHLVKEAIENEKRSYFAEHINKNYKDSKKL